MLMSPKQISKIAADDPQRKGSIGSFPDSFSTKMIPMGNKLVQQTSAFKLEHHGTEYGGWTCDVSTFTSNTIVYDVGLGEDTSWDEGLIQKYNLQIFGFDPTPKSALHVDQTFPARTHFHYLKEGLSTRKETKTFTKPKNAGKGTIGIYIEKAYKNNRFNLIGKNIANEKEIFEIFKSIKFKDSDLKINSKTIEFSDKITPYSGKSLFKVLCASCHMKNRKFIGPAFYGIDELKFKKWLIYSSENNVLNKNEYGINYHQEKFGKVLKQSEIEQIIEFSKSE
jgi:hypothetical protein